MNTNSLAFNKRTQKKPKRPELAKEEPDEIAKRFREYKRGVAGIDDITIQSQIGNAKFIHDREQDKSNPFFDRQKRQKEQHLLQSQNTRDLQVEANLRDKELATERFSRFVMAKHVQERKERAREEYKERQARKPPKGVLFQTDMSIDKRVYLYGKHHRCPHKRVNTYITSDNKLRCHCERLIFTPLGSKCTICGSSSTMLSTDTLCRCHAVFCNRCRRFLYRYGDVKQYYDKHAEDRIMIEGQDIQLNFKHLLTQQTSTIKPRVGLKDFLEDRNRSFADVLTKKTVKEGASLSSISGTTTAGFDAVKSKILDFKNKAIKKIEDTMDAVRDFAKRYVAGKYLLKFLDALTYYIRVLCDYLWALNPIMILRLWTARDNKLLLLASLIEAVGILKTAEEASILRLQLLISENGIKSARSIVARGVGHLGALDTVMRHIAINAPSDVAFQAEALHCALLGKKYDTDSEYELPEIKNKSTSEFVSELRDEETEAESMAGICTIISSFFRDAPKKFAYGAKALAVLFKEYMPLLMGIKAIGDLSKMIGQVVNRLVTYITGTVKDNREWLNHQITSEGNPISELIKNFVAYSVKSMKPSFHEDGENTTKLRAKLYEGMSDCDVYVTAQGRMGTAWLDLRTKLNSALSVPPRTEVREFEPTCLVMSGPAGAGKSTLWMAIVAQDVLTDEELKDRENILKRVIDQTFTWNSSSEYQPGMADKKIILFDDFQQNKEEVDEALALIHLCTNAPYPINSPNISGPEIKGMMATPEIVVVNTNLPVNIAGQNLASPDALRRRYDIEFEMLERYDPADPKKKILKVKRSNRYKKLENVALCLADARNLFHMTHASKRRQFAQTKEMVTKFITTDVTPEMFLDTTKIIDNEIPKDLWQGDEDYKKDFEEFVLKPYQLKHAKTQAEAGAILDIVDITVANILWSTSTAAPLSLALTIGYVIRDFSQDLYALCFTKEMTFKKWAVTTLSRLFKCGIVAITSSIAMYSAYKYLVPEYESGTSRTAKMRDRVSVPEGNSSLGEGLSNRIMQATGTITVRETGTTTNCLFIGGTFILIPRHLVVDDDGILITKGSFIVRKSTWRGKTIECEIDGKCFRFMKGNVDKYTDREAYREDVCLYMLPPALFSPEKNIVKHFWNGDHSLKNYTVTEYDWIHNQTWNDTGDGQWRLATGVVTHDYIRTIRKEGEIKVYHIFAEATYQGRPMSCGSAIVLERQEQPIVGVHVAHSLSGESCFHYVTRKALQDAMSLNLVVDVEEPYTLEEVQSESAVILRHALPPKSVICPVGETTTKVFQPTKTALSKSAVHDIFPPVLTEPAVLSYKDPRIKPEYAEPVAFWTKLFAGYKSTEKTFNEEHLEQAYQSLIHETAGHIKKTKVPQRLLTIDETINGITYVNGNTSMDKSTSMGWPYVQQGMKKADHFKPTGFEQDHQPLYAPSSMITQDYMNALLMIQKGVVPFLPFTLTLKDERLKRDKIADPRTRIFACANVIHYMISRRYFYSYLMMNYQLPVRENFCAPALDRISLDWHALSVHMLEGGNEGFDFDFTNWDRTLQHSVIRKAVSIMLLPVKNEMSDLEIETLQELMASPYMIFGSTVLRSTGVLMSGALVTYMLNCLSNELIHRAAYIGIMSEMRPDLASISYYKQYTRGIRGGDDTITTVHPFIADYYNGLTVSEYFQNSGMIVTASSKTDQICNYRSYFDLLFLKNKTQLIRGMYLPLPDYYSLLESVRYVRLGTTKDVIKATRANVECALRGFYFHGKAKYTMIYDELLRICPELYPISTYYELNKIWKEYYRFPGAHADFSTAAVQDNLIETQPTEHPLKQEARAYEEEYTMKTTLETKLTTTESGEVHAMDKAEIEQNVIFNAQAIDPTPAPPAKEVVNNEAEQVEKREVSRVGATVQDAADVKMMPVKTGNITTSSKNDRAQQYLNDVGWDLQKLAHKFTFIEDFEWKTTDTVGTILKSYVIPKDIIVTPAQKAPFDVTRFWKCSDVLLKVVVKASPFYAGSLGLGFTPFSNPPSVKQMINMGALIQKVSQDEGLEFSIPFRYPLGYLNAATERLGSFCVFVISPLATGPGNPTTISVSLYAAMENNEFKLPDVIPSTLYHSRKFDPPATIVTMPEAGKATRSVLCDINDDLRSMQKVMLCAGEGTVGRPKVSHFQDAPDDIMQLLKRWTFGGRFEVAPAAMTSTKISFSIQELTELACLGADRMFGLYRGSVNVRIVMKAPTGDHNAYVTLHPYDLMTDVIYPTNQGFQYFDNEVPAQITIPWLQPTFTWFSPYVARAAGQPIQGNLVINLDTYTTAGPVFFEVHVCVGDDFHMGVFTGAPALLFVPEIALSAVSSVKPLAINEVTAIPTKITKKQSGVVQFVQRAIETTLPVAEEVSALLSLLDAHMITEQPAPLQWRKVPFSVACDNVQYTERMLTTNHNGMSLPDKECFGVSTSETSIHNLLTGTKTWMRNVKWSATDTPGTVLTEEYTGPESPVALPGYMTQAIPLNFGFWTGSTILIFDIIATEMHRGQLLFVFNTVPETIGYTDATQTYFCTYDLSRGRGTIALQLPYLSPQPFTRTAQETDFEYFKHTGLLRVFVQNPLRGTATVASDVDIVVYKAYGEDFQLGVYGATLTSGVPETS